MSGFLENAAALLAEPDPGPTPFLVESLIVERAIGAIQGPPKVGKTWVGLELGVSIATGGPAFGRFATLKGPVVVILEESGRAALHRRLDALARGRAIKPDQLAGLHFAANRRVRLNDPQWRERILADFGTLKPRAVIFDPLVRLKGANTSENDQAEMAVVLDFLRDLRDALETAVVFVHHTGHGGTHLRGTSDLEANWESKLALTRTTDGTTEVVAEHREAESPEPFAFRQAWDQHGSLRLHIPDDGRAQQLRQAIAVHVSEHPGSTTEEIAKGVEIRKAECRSQLTALETAGTVTQRPSQTRDRRGVVHTRKCWHPASQSQLATVPQSRTETDPHHPAGSVGPTVPAFKSGTGTGPDTKTPNSNGHAGPDSLTIEDAEADRRRVQEMTR